MVWALGWKPPSAWKQKFPSAIAAGMYHFLETGLVMLLVAKLAVPCVINSSEILQE
jgi:hypothetical protein